MSGVEFRIKHKNNIIKNNHKKMSRHHKYEETGDTTS